MSTTLQLPPRIIGTEMEYGRGANIGAGSYELTDFLPPGLYSIEQFLSNGARFYKDTGEKFEYATPECAGALDATAAEFAGQQIVHHAVELLISRKRLTRVPLRKCVVDDTGETWGYHENYGMRREEYAAQVHREFLIAHLATRAVLMGAGRIVRDNNGTYHTLPAQKTEAAKLLVSANYSDKAIFNTRDEAHADVKLWARQHVVCGDPNITPRTTLLKLGSTSMVIRLGETGFGKNGNLLAEGTGLFVAKSVGNDPSMSRRYTTRDGKSLTALCLQEALLEQCEAMSGEFELPEDELQALSIWREDIDVSRNDPDTADKRIEWRAKDALLEEYVTAWKQKKEEAELEKDPIKDDSSVLDDLENAVQAVSNAWDHIDPKKNVGFRWMKAHKDSPVSQALIDSYVRRCPRNTRAEQRAGFIKNNHRRRAEGGMNWGKGWVGSKKFVMAHPYGRRRPKVTS